TIAQRVAAAFVLHANITGIEPAVPQTGRSRIRIIPVSQHHDITTALDFSDLAGLAFIAFIIDDAHVDPRSRPANRTEHSIRPVVEIALAEAGDGHGALALAI